MSFSSNSAFNQTDLSQLEDKVRDQLFAPRTSEQAEMVINLPVRVVREWERELDDALWEIEDGSTAGLSRCVTALERLRETITTTLQNATVSG